MPSFPWRKAFPQQHVALCRSLCRVRLLPLGDLVRCRLASLWYKCVSTFEIEDIISEVSPCECVMEPDFKVIKLLQCESGDILPPIFVDNYSFKVSWVNQSLFNNSTPVQTKFVAWFPEIRSLITDLICRICEGVQFGAGIRFLWGHISWMFSSLVSTF